ncbi:MAG: phage/plasmid primase, P4 family [Gammaproteobacteria bacterium]
MSALDQQFSLSLLTATSGRATKRIVADAQGRPVKDVSASLGISAGRVEPIAVAGLEGLRTLLLNVTPKQALIHGIPKGSRPGDRFKLVTADKFTGAPGTIARTLQCFEYPPDARLIMLDIDPDPSAPTTVNSAAELMAMLAEILPALGGAGWLATVSTSSAIRARATGEWLAAPRGLHVYLIAVGDVARFRETLKVRLWLAGHGFCKLASPNVQTGVAAILERCLIDLSVFSPERLDYVAGAQIDGRLPFFQDRPAPELHEGPPLDLDAIPPPSAEELERCRRRIADAKSALKPQQARTVEVYVRQTTPGLLEADLQREVTERLTRAERDELTAEHLLYFDNGERVRVAEVSPRLDGWTLADPQEPDYGPGKAKLYWNNGHPRIHSLAHGASCTYTLLMPMASAAPASDAQPLESTLTDTGNAKRFADQYGRDVHYVHEFGRWFVFTGHHWQRDDSGAIMRQARQVALAIYAEAARVNDPDTATLIAAHAKRSLSLKSICAMLELAKSEPGAMIGQKALDADPLLLGVKNGVIDLRTGAFRAGERADLITKTTPIAFDAGAVCPRWVQFIAEIMRGNDALIAYLQRLCGYILTGDVREQCFDLLYGIGANGKSTFLEILLAVLGNEYARMAAPDLLIARKHDRHPTELADLRGARLVVSVETGEGRRLDENRVKQLTGGDTMKGRLMRQDFFEFDPTFKLLLATNHKPAIKGTDHAIWRRVHLVPFAKVFTKEERDEGLKDKLLAELPGILNWCVQGCLAWQRQGLAPPDEVIAATADYRKEMDVIQNFLGDCCVIQPGLKVAKAEFYRAYTRWCDDNGEHPMSQRDLSRRMQDRGFVEAEGHKGGRKWAGIGLLAPAGAVPDMAAALTETAEEAF